MTEGISRCFHCNKPFTNTEIHAEGCCPDCGSRKMREVHRKITDADMERLVARGFDPSQEWEWKPDA